MESSKIRFHSISSGLGPGIASSYSEAAYSTLSLASFMP